MDDATEGDGFRPDVIAAGLASGSGSDPSPMFRDAFVGREHEEAAIRALLMRPSTRLLTLTGTGGVGKTRLAAAIAEQTGSMFGDGAVFVPLVTVREPDRFLDTVARAVGMRDPGSGQVAERLAEHLRLQHLFLILDNLEQLLGVAPQIAKLLAACPDLVILTTSREHLQISGEHVFLVPSLSLPLDLETAPVDEIAEAEAVRLFVIRSQARKPNFALTADNAGPIAAICRGLDGLALALELAAALSAELSPREILARLEARLPLLTDGPHDVPDRHRTMRTAIAWSYDLLTPSEQSMFRWLGVFGSSFSVEAVTAIFGDDLDWSASAADLVLALTAKSLLQRVPVPGGELRYRMLDTVREFALDQLAERGEASAARTRHADWYVEQGEGLWNALLREPIRAAPLDWAETEHDNFRAALAWLDSTDQADGLLRLTGAIWPFWFLHSHMAEWEGWTARSLPHIDVVSPQVRALFFQGAARAVAAVGRPIGGIAGAEFTARSLALFREIDHTWGIATALYAMGADALDEDALPDARRHLRESVRLLEEIDDPGWRSLAIQELGEVAFAERDLAQAHQYFTEAHDHRALIGDPWGISWTSSYLGLVAVEQGQFDTAVRSFVESLPYLLDVGSSDGQLRWIARVGVLLVRVGRAEVGLRLLGAYQSGADRLGARVRLAQRTAYAAAIDDARSELGEERFAICLAEGGAFSIEEAIGLARLELQKPMPQSHPLASESLPTTVRLTRREREVLAQLAQGLPNREIAQRLFIGDRTVATHIDAIYRKLDVSTRSAAAAFAVRHGLG